MQSCLNIQLESRLQKGMYIPSVKEKASQRPALSSFPYGGREKAPLCVLGLACSPAEVLLPAVFHERVGVGRPFPPEGMNTWSSPQGCFSAYGYIHSLQPNSVSQHAA